MTNKNEINTPTGIYKCRKAGQKKWMRAIVFCNECGDKCAEVVIDKNTHTIDLMRNMNTYEWKFVRSLSSFLNDRCEVRVEMLRKTNTIHGGALITKSKLYGYCACKNEVLAHTKYCNNCGTLLNWNTK